MPYVVLTFLGLTAAWAGERCDSGTDEFTANRLLLSSAVYQKRPVRERFRALREAHPGLDNMYLEGASLVGSDTKAALRIYAQILEQDPDYPWVHLSQLEIYRAETFRDYKKLDESFVAITRVCPALYDPYRYLSAIADNELAARAALKLRTMLKDATEPTQLALFRGL